MRRCLWVGVLVGCLVGGCPLPDMGGEGQDCFDPPDRCNSGFVCVGGVCVRPDCTRWQDCPTGQYCDEDFYTCESGCSDSAQCDTGFFCNQTNHECTRDPDAPAGLGEPCFFTTDFGTTHPEANNCESNLRCIGYNNEGAQGYCPDQSIEECWIIYDVYNPDCVDGVCGGSFCCALCSGDTCPTNYEPLELQSGECVCIPQPASDECHPLNQDCLAGEACVPASGLRTRCIPAGTVGPDQPCDALQNQLCQKGYMCLGSGEDYNCLKLCDQNNSSTCDSGFVCSAISEVERWGYCKADVE